MYLVAATRAISTRHNPLLHHDALPIFFAADPALYSDTVTAIALPQGIDGNALVAHADESYGVSFGAGLGEVAGRVFRIGHLGKLTEVQALAGIATAEMALADFDVPIVPGAGVAAAQSYFRKSKGA